MTLKLDGQIRATLGYPANGFEGLRLYGLAPNQVRQATPRYAMAESVEKRDKFGAKNGIVAGTIIDKNNDLGENIHEHIKGKASDRRFHHYKEPRIVNGQVVTSKRLKDKSYSTGVVYPVEEPIERPGFVSGQPGEEYVTFSPERWDGNRVNMHGTQRNRTNTGFRGSKAKKVWTKKY